MKISINLHLILLMFFYVGNCFCSDIVADFSNYCKIDSANQGLNEQARRNLLAVGDKALPFLRQRIKSAKSIEVQNAAELLGELGAIADEPLLLGLLEGTDVFAAKNAASALVSLYSRFPDSELVSRINLHNTSQTSLMAALYAAYLYGKGAGQVSTGVETAAARVLLKSDIPQVQLGAAQVLRYSGTNTGIAALLKCAAKEATAAIVLCEICSSLEVIAPAGQSATIEKLSMRPEPELQLAAMGVLGKLNYAGVTDALKVLAGNTDPRVRAGAIQKLSKYGNLMNMGDFIAALDDSDPQVRLEAVLALGKLANSAAAMPLRKLMGKNGDKHPVVRAQAALAFAKTGSVGALSPLLEDVRDISKENRAFRLEAIRVLGELGDKGAVRALGSCLSETDIDIAVAAVSALASIGGENSKGLLAQAVNDGKPVLAAAAQSALQILQKSGTK